MLPMVGNMKKYIRIWWKLATATTQVAFISQFGVVLFVVGKLIRFFFFFLFIILIVSKTKVLSGYSIWQIVLFYATFNIIDAITQFFLREVYRFRNYISNGTFDYILIKPISPLFRSLFGGSDVLDLPMLLISLIFVIFSIFNVGHVFLENIFLYVFLLINAFFIALALHILVLVVGVFTTSVDNAIMLYRDFTLMGRLPVDIYLEPLRGIITFIIPVGVMMTFPPKALFGLLSLPAFGISFLIGVTLLVLSVKLWSFSLKNYSSA